MKGKNVETFSQYYEEMVKIVYFWLNYNDYIDIKLLDLKGHLVHKI
jgi:hypothetical protein